MLPLLAALIPAAVSLIGDMVKGGDKDKPADKSGAALSSIGALGAMGSAAGQDHPISKGHDLPPVLATVLSQRGPAHSGHVAMTGGRYWDSASQRWIEFDPAGRTLTAKTEHALRTLGAKQAAEPATYHQEKAGRAVIRRVEASVSPQLTQLLNMQKARALQIQATAEHRRLKQQEDRWRQLSGQQATILDKVSRIERHIGRFNTRF